MWIYGCVGKPAGKRNAFGVLLIGVHHSIQSGYLIFGYISSFNTIGRLFFDRSNVDWFHQQWAQIDVTAHLPLGVSNDGVGESSGEVVVCNDILDPAIVAVHLERGYFVSNKRNWADKDIKAPRRNWEQSAWLHALQSHCSASAPWKTNLASFH